MKILLIKKKKNNIKYLYFFSRYDRLVLEQESKQKEWEMKYTQKTEEVDKLNKQITSLDHQLQNQREAHSKQESENIKMQFEVS